MTSGRWLFILGLLLGTTLLAGCGGGGGEEAGGAGGNAPAIRSGGLSEDESTEENRGSTTAPSTPSLGPMGMMGPMGGGMGGPMGGGMTGGTQEAGAQLPRVTSKPPSVRPDPFAPWWSTTPPPPPAITLVEPYRVATRESVVRPPEEKVEVEEVPNRRVAGIATGQGVYALVEGPEGQNVVRPGDMVGEYRVEAIRSRSVILKRTVGNVTYTQEVPLTDVGSQVRATYVGGMRGAPGGAGRIFRGGAGAGYAPPAGGGGMGAAAGPAPDE